MRCHNDIFGQYESDNKFITEHIRKRAWSEEYDMYSKTSIEKVIFNVLNLY